MSDMMTFPATVEEFMEQYKIVDDEKVYTNGADLVPIFRMMQWFEHVSAMDTISRQAAIMDAESWAAVDEYEKHLQKNVVEWLKEFPPAELGTNMAEVGTRAVRGYPIDADALMEKVAEEYGERARDRLYQIIRYMPPAEPKQRTGKWITQDHNKRAGNISTCVYYYPICSKCGKVGIETYKYCPHCGAKMNQSDKTCDCYSDGRCIGTKEIDPCSCGGNKSKCDFYENVRREEDAE